jgi:AcrR family transcriptional regulator
VPGSHQSSRSTLAPVLSVRDEIIEVARRELTARGLSSMTIRQVARLAGVDPGTVRHYFQTKDQLVLAAVGPGPELLEAYRRAAAEVTGHGAKGAGLVAAAVRSLSEDPVAEVALSVCLTGGDYESTVFGAFDREVVAQVARDFAGGNREERSAMVMSAFLGLQLLATLLPDTAYTLRDGKVQAVLADSIERYLEAG